MMPTARFLLSGKRSMYLTYEYAVVSSGVLSACLRAGRRLAVSLVCADASQQSFNSDHYLYGLLMSKKSFRSLGKFLGKFWESLGKVLEFLSARRIMATSFRIL